MVCFCPIRAGTLYATENQTVLLLTGENDFTGEGE
jgi:hypothetical protein